jgi:hypothetical protein
MCEVPREFNALPEGKCIDREKYVYPFRYQYQWTDSDCSGTPETVRDFSTCNGANRMVHGGDTVIGASYTPTAQPVELPHSWLSATYYSQSDCSDDPAAISARITNHCFEKEHVIYSCENGKQKVFCSSILFFFLFFFTFSIPFFPICRSSISNQVLEY